MAGLQDKEENNAMTVSLTDAKARLDLVIGKARVDLYKPIQIAEVLYNSRLFDSADFDNLETFRNPSIHCRNTVTRRLSGKRSTSSARYQDDVWNENAMPPNILAVLDQENKVTNGLVERYIYLHYSQVQGTVTEIMAVIKAATPETFSLSLLLELFVREKGIRRSIDKAYEVVTFSLFETVVTNLDAVSSIKVPAEKGELLVEFKDLARVLLGIEPDHLSWEQPAHIYRVGVTNAADRGLDMWANFGPAVQVKHITLDDGVAQQIVDQVESDYIVVVCRDADAGSIRTFARQIAWGQRVRGIVTESDLVAWYEKCLRGKYASLLAKPLLTRLSDGFIAEFPQVAGIVTFLEERAYTKMSPTVLWRTPVDANS